MQRVTVTLEDRQAAQLARLAQQSGLSTSGLMRFLVNRLVREPVLFLPTLPTDSRQEDDPSYAEAAR